MINILDMKVDGEKKRLRESIPSPQGNIEVYEPTLEQVSQIVNLAIEENENAFETGLVKFDAGMTIHVVFPMLTNIDLKDLDEEALKDIIQNPSIHLIMAQQAVELIIHECMTLYAMRMKSELKGAESQMAQVELLNAIPQYVLEVAKKDGKASELAEKYKEISDKVDELAKNENEKEADSE